MKKAEILAPAGNLASLKAAIDAGADVVYVGFNDATNARNFEGLNFTTEDLEEGRRYIKKKGKKFYLVINTFPQMEAFDNWQKAVDNAVKFQADALIIADLGVLKYTRDKYPDQEIHLSVQASSSNYESINFYKKQFGITRVVLPRVVTLREINELRGKTDVQLEVFAMGGLCINIEGRCYLSSFLTGASTNTEGACSPSRFVDFSTTPGGGMDISLNGVVLNRLGKDEPSPYPTSCKGRYVMPDGTVSYAIEEPESLNTLEIIPELIEAGVVCFKIEGRQRTKTYVAEMVTLMRDAVDSYYRDPESYVTKPEWLAKAAGTFEGSTNTKGSLLGK